MPAIRTTVRPLARQDTFILDNPDHAPEPVRQAHPLIELGGTPEETESIGLSNETCIPCRYRPLPPSPPVRLAGWTSVLAGLRRRIA